MTTRSEEKLEKKCIEDFYIRFYQHLTEDAQDIGIEEGLECCYALFKENRLRLRMESIDNYIIYSYENDEMIIIYNKEEQNKRKEVINEG